MTLKYVLPPGAFRLLLALTVVLSHISRFDVGRLAVLLFFFLSGYWVSKVWTERFGPRATLRFYAARYLRIAPLYLIVVVAAALLGSSPTGLENFTLLGVASSNRDPLGVSWSLDIELQFYLLLPLLVPLLLRSSLWTGLGLIILSAAAWTVALQTSLVTVAQYLPVFALGSLAYIFNWQTSERNATISLAAFLIAFAVACATPFIDKKVADPFDRDIFAFFWMLPLLPYVVRSLHMKAGRLDRHLGNISFPLYLVHHPIIEWVSKQLGDVSRSRLLGVAIAAAVAIGLYLVVDRRIDAWRVRLTEGGRSSVVDAPS